MCIINQVIKKRAQQNLHAQVNLKESAWGKKVFNLTVITIIIVVFTRVISIKISSSSSSEVFVWVSLHWGIASQCHHSVYYVNQTLSSSITTWGCCTGWCAWCDEFLFSVPPALVPAAIMSCWSWFGLIMMFCCCELELIDVDELVFMIPVGGLTFFGGGGGIGTWIELFISSDKGEL